MVAQCSLCLCLHAVWTPTDSAVKLGLNGWVPEQFALQMSDSSSSEGEELAETVERLKKRSKGRIGLCPQVHYVYSNFGIPFMRLYC